MKLEKRGSFIWWINKMICRFSGRCVLPTDEQFLAWLEKKEPVTCNYCGKVYTL